MKLTTKDIELFAVGADLEPRLLRLQNEIRAELRGDRYCANGVWYPRLKPVMSFLVGFDAGMVEEQTVIEPWLTDDERIRRDACLHDPRQKYPVGYVGVRIYVGNEILDMPPWHEYDSPRDPILKTSEMYDACYVHLYSQLPDCFNCACA